VNDWDRLVRTHGPAVFGLAWRILGQAADAEDVVQDVFLQVHLLQRTLKVRCWPAFLRRLTTCRALDRLRQRRSAVPLDGLALYSNEDEPDAALLEKELAQRLRDSLSQLPPREASVFCLRYFEDLSYQQIADALQIQVGAVSAALHKARGRLEALLLEPIQGD
jgi:RNA polymerase sigma-70 factor (ECF subfamily)